MTRINPFDFSPNQGIGNAGSVNSPEKINQNNKQNETQGAQGIGDFQKSNEDTMVDASSMVDDTEGFDMSGFEGEDKSGTVNSTDKTNESEQGKESGKNNEKDKEEMMAQAEDMINNFFKKNSPES